MRTRRFSVWISLPNCWNRLDGLNPEISFRQGNGLALDMRDETLAGIAAFYAYAIVNIPPESLPPGVQEMERVLLPGGLLLLAFHTGDVVLHEDELWGRPNLNGLLPASALGNPTASGGYGTGD
jgi:hypothetical protein